MQTALDLADLVGGRVRRFTVTEPVFKVEPLFLLGCSFESLKHYMHDRYRQDVGIYEGQLGTMFTFDKAPYRVIWTERLDRAVVLHEVFHLVTRICSDRGIVIRAHDEQGNCGDETAAFLFEFFARAVLRRLK